MRVTARSRRFSPILTLLLALLLSSGCLTDPPVAAGLAPAETGVIQGEAVILWPLEQPAPVVLLLYQLLLDESGVPVGQAFADATIIPASELDEGGLEGGGTVRTASFTFPLVEPGLYVVSGLVDVDQNFYLLEPTLAVPTAGDILGGYADTTTGKLLPIAIEANTVAGEISALFAGPPYQPQ